MKPDEKKAIWLALVIVTIVGVIMKIVLHFTPLVTVNPG
jgi:hypothetical protein